jgi:hypothetical protein
MPIHIHEPPVHGNCLLWKSVAYILFLNLFLLRNNSSDKECSAQIHVKITINELPRAEFLLRS